MLTLLPRSCVAAFSVCERELWLPVSSHLGALPRRFVDMAGPVSITGGSSDLHEHVWGGGFVGAAEETLLQDGAGVEYFQSPYISMLNCFYFVGIVVSTHKQRDGRCACAAFERS